MDHETLNISKQPLKAHAAASQAAAVIGRAVAKNFQTAPGSLSQL
jgi:hypothetical protein